MLSSAFLTPGNMWRVASDPPKSLDGRNYGLFRSLLLELSNSLTANELGQLKFLCGDVLPKGRLDSIKEGFELFEALEHLNKLSEKKRDFLASKLSALNRVDLRNKLLGTQG